MNILPYHVQPVYTDTDVNTHTHIHIYRDRNTSAHKIVPMAFVAMTVALFVVCVCFFLSPSSPRTRQDKVPVFE